jgi:hypothetical protein
MKYYKHRASPEIAKNILLEIISESNKLINAPYIGQEEGMLKAEKFIIGI